MQASKVEIKKRRETMPPLNEVKRDINNLVRLPKDESFRSLSNERPIGLMETNSMSRKRLNLKRIDEQLR